MLVALAKQHAASGQRHVLPQRKKTKQTWEHCTCNLRPPPFTDPAATLPLLGSTHPTCLHAISLALELLCAHDTLPSPADHRPQASESESGSESESESGTMGAAAVDAALFNAASHALARALKWHYRGCTHASQAVAAAVTDKARDKPKCLAPSHVHSQEGVTVVQRAARLTLRQFGVRNGGPAACKWLSFWLSLTTAACQSAQEQQLHERESDKGEEQENKEGEGDKAQREWGRPQLQQQEEEEEEEEEEEQQQQQEQQRQQQQQPAFRPTFLKYNHY